MERIGKFTILDRIGKGAMGVVYRAWDDSLGEVAVKVMSADVRGDEVQHERFIREARVAAALDHPHIIDIHGMGEHEGRPYIVMELLDGEPLKGLIYGRDEVSLERRLELMLQVTGALAYAHRAGVLHRDIKPENIFVTRTGDVRILDFGVARLQGSTMTAAGALVGTPCYMSPEQVAGQKVDRRCDIFSTGSVFYELLTGARAFAGRVDDVFDKVLNQQPAPIHAINDLLPRELSAIVAKAMAKEPDRRYQSMDEMVRQLALFSAALAGQREKLRREAEAALQAATTVSARGLGNTGVRSTAELPHDYLGLQAFLRGLQDDRDQLDVLIDELQWVAEVSTASLDGYGQDTLRAMANRVDEIREQWPGEPTVIQLGRRLLEQLRARLAQPHSPHRDPRATASGELVRRV